MSGEQSQDRLVQPNRCCRLCPKSVKNVENQFLGQRSSEIAWIAFPLHVKPNFDISDRMALSVCRQDPSLSRYRVRIRIRCFENRRFDPIGDRIRQSRWTKVVQNGKLYESRTDSGFYGYFKNSASFSLWYCYGGWFKSKNPKLNTYISWTQAHGRLWDGTFYAYSCKFLYAIEFVAKDWLFWNFGGENGQKTHFWLKLTVKKLKIHSKAHDVANPTISTILNNICSGTLQVSCFPVEICQ